MEDVLADEGSVSLLHDVISGLLGRNSSSMEVWVDNLVVDDISDTPTQSKIEVSVSVDDMDIGKELNEALNVRRNHMARGLSSKGFKVQFKVVYRLRHGRMYAKDLIAGGEELKSLLWNIVDGGLLRSVLLEKATERSSILVSVTPSSLTIKDSISWRCSTHSSSGLLDRTLRKVSSLKSADDAYETGAISEVEYGIDVSSESCEGRVIGTFDAHQVKQINK